MHRIGKPIRSMLLYELGFGSLMLWSGKHCDFIASVLLCAQVPGC